MWGWGEIAVALVGLFSLFCYFFLHDDDIPHVDSADTDLVLEVAGRLQETHGGRVYAGLQIPDPETNLDPETGSRRRIDIVLVTRKGVIVVAVRNLSGLVENGRDGTWVCTKIGKNQPETYPDPVLEIHRQVEILELYLEQRGVSPKGHIIGKVVLPNPNCRITHAISVQPEVISFDEWTKHKPESEIGFSNWRKDMIYGAKGEMQDNLHQKLHSILGTSPMCDRLELKSGRIIFGEFMRFKGTQEDMQAVRNVNRSEVSRIIILKPSIFGLGRSWVPVLYCPRDYRSDGTSSSEWIEMAVEPSFEVLFQPLNSKKALEFKITSIVSVSLSV